MIINSIRPGIPKNPRSAGIALFAYLGVVSLVAGWLSFFTAVSTSSSIPWIPFLNSTIDFILMDNFSMQEIEKEFLKSKFFIR